MESREKTVDCILKRGIIVQVLPDEQKFRARLLSTSPLKIYIGADPTSSTLHLSHAKNYQLLEEFRRLGHEVYVLFGDFTARIGDPSGQSSKRKQLSQEEVKKNVLGWMQQIKPLMNFNDESNPPKIVYNHDWLSKITMEQLVGLASQFTVQQMLERDMFAKRMQEKKPIYLHEFLYPLMQGYDSVALDVDVELCGTDQIFNALVGRQLQKSINEKEKFVVAVNLMENPKTGELMSKSRGTGVFLDASPFDMYGAIMAQPDEMIRVLFVNNTRIALPEIDVILQSMPPRDAKMALAREITKIFHGEATAIEAENQFILLVQKKGQGTNVPEVRLGASEASLFATIRHCLEPEISNSEIRRLISQHAIYINGLAVAKPETLVTIPVDGIQLRVGKKRWFKVLP